LIKFTNEIISVMKNFDLNSLGVHEMNALEMQETDGGLIGLLVAAVAVLLLTSSCNFEANFQFGGSHNTIQSNDSLQNGWQADSTNVVLDLKPLPK
jgi:hypothetical protein